MAELPSGTVTLLFTDVEGSTRLLQELGAARYADALAEHRRLVRDAFGAHGGVEVDTQGDAFFCAFESAPAAVAAASAAQEALAQGDVKVRMGLHTGAPHRTAEGYVGDAVHLGARVAAAAHGRQIVLSKATRDLLDDSFAVRDLGEHRVKDFDEPVWIYQLGDTVFPPLRTISNTNLPRPASSFVGREREVADVVALVRGSRLVTLTGPGGSGKTRLSIEAASEVLGDFKAGTFWVGLATVQDAADVLPAVARTIGGDGDLAAIVGERELLLVLDNLEQVIDAAAELAALVEACPNLHLLATSREPLRVRGEVEYDVLPLADPDAVELFCLRSALESSPEVEQLCRRLDNMPLALELAAARTKALTPAQILDRLDERLDLFRGGRDADERQRTLRGTIEWSHDLLDQDERRLFARLGVFAGGCTLEAAETVACADLDTLQSLVEKSLVRHTDNRFWMLETIREYAAERLAASGDADDLQRRSAALLLNIGESANLIAESQGPEQHELIRPELDNFRAAIDWAVDHDLALAFRLAISLEQFWVVNDAFEGVRRFAALLERRAEVEPALIARALRVYGESRWISGDYAGGVEAMEESLAMFEQIGDERAIAVGLHRLGTGALMADDLPRARRLIEESLAMSRRTPDPKLEADAVGKLGAIERQAGNPEGALELFERSAILCEQAGSTWLQAHMVLNAAELSHELGSNDVADQLAGQGLRLSVGLVDRQSLVYSLALLARLARSSGDLCRAGRLWGAIETEESRGPVGQWEWGRDELAEAIVVDDPEFESARMTGRRLTLDEACEYALAGRKEAARSSGGMST
jgi:predicted ATPase/class 3 adenylate cyclase